LITVLFALLFKYLPDAKIEWRDIWFGAAFTALLFTIGKFVIGLYLGKSDVSTTFGAAGSLAVILIWVYYSSQILFFGAEFTQVYANKFGSRIVPVGFAVPLTENDRHKQGIPHEEAKAASTIHSK
jgi:membrane protein